MIWHFEALSNDILKGLKPNRNRTETDRNRLYTSAS